MILKTTLIVGRFGCSQLYVGSSWSRDRGDRGCSIKSFGLNHSSKYNTTFGANASIKFLDIHR